MLLPRVLAARPHARIVTVATTGCVISEVNLRNYNWDVCSSTRGFFWQKSIKLMLQDGKTYHPWKACASPKTANILFSTFLSSHFKYKGVECLALQPRSTYRSQSATMTINQLPSASYHAMYPYG
jgi:hypothetical protein